MAVVFALSASCSHATPGASLHVPSDGSATSTAPAAPSAAPSIAPSAAPSVAPGSIDDDARDEKILACKRARCWSRGKSCFDTCYRLNHPFNPQGHEACNASCRRSYGYDACEAECERDPGK